MGFCDIIAEMVFKTKSNDLPEGVSGDPFPTDFGGGIRMSENNPVRVVEVTTKQQLREFVTYPNKHYGANPNFVPSFYQDDLADWDKSKNPAMEYCDARAFLAYRGDRIVGRIGAILSHKANEK